MYICVVFADDAKTFTCPLRFFMVMGELYLNTYPLPTFPGKGMIFTSRKKATKSKQKDAYNLVN